VCHPPLGFSTTFMQASISKAWAIALSTLIDREFVGDELFQRMGFLECVQEAQAARVAGRGMVGHSKQANLVREQMPVRIDRDYLRHRRTRPRRAGSLAGDYAARGDLHPISLSSR